MVSKVVNLCIRPFRHVFSDRSYERYYSLAKWDLKYREEKYDLSGRNEDGRYGALLQILRRYDCGTMLDLGCGDGLLWQKYRPLSDCELIGIDYSPAAVAKANALNIPHCRFDCGDYRTFRPDQPISVVIFNESLYYIDDFLTALRKSNEWLNEGGVVVISMFDTLVTRRIWKKILHEYVSLQAVTIKDHESRRSWTIRVFPRTQPAQP
jgi:trans-aconitate methyltransferase